MLKVPKTMIGRLHVLRQVAELCTELREKSKECVSLAEADLENFKGGSSY